MKIEKKIWPEFYKKILDGDKKFELRLADFECKPGDILVLMEWDPQTNKYTGNKIEKEISYVAKTKNQTFWTKEQVDKYGFQIISFK